MAEQPTRPARSTKSPGRSADKPTRSTTAARPTKPAKSAVLAARKPSRALAAIAPGKGAAVGPTLEQQARALADELIEVRRDLKRLKAKLRRP